MNDDHLRVANFLKRKMENIEMEMSRKALAIKIDKGHRVRVLVCPFCGDSHEHYIDAKTIKEGSCGTFTSGCSESEDADIEGEYEVIIATKKQVAALKQIAKKSSFWIIINQKEPKGIIATHCCRSQALRLLSEAQEYYKELLIANNRVVHLIDVLDAHIQPSNIMDVIKCRDNKRIESKTSESTNLE